MLKLLQGDCLEVMRGLPDKSVDCFVCDLPYGCLASGKEMTPEQKKKAIEKWGQHLPGKTFQGCAWDVALPLEPFWAEVKRLAKDEHTPVLMFCTTKFGYELIKSNEKWFRYDLVWDKQRGVSFLSANKMPMRSHEMIYVFSKAGAYYERVDISGNYPGWSVKRASQVTHCYAGVKRTDTSGGDGKRCVRSVIQVNGHESRHKGQHPTEKPLSLYSWLIERYCPEGGTILDPTAGSCNSCFAAVALGRKAIGIEKDEGFFKKAKERAEAAGLLEPASENQIVESL